jgi:hypothetical protein
MRRAGAGIDRNVDGTWTIASDHLHKVSAHEARLVRGRPVTIETLSPVPLAHLERAEAATWLDRELAAVSPLPVRDAGFGKELHSALAVRRQWLIEQQLADEESGKLRVKPNALQTLERRELIASAQELASELGKPFAEARPDSIVEGTLTRRMDLVSGRYALVEQSKEFTLLPWRSVLERRIGKNVGGLMRPEGINWRFERSRGGPAIS